jgi:hypothetical protein
MIFSSFLTMVFVFMTLYSSVFVKQPAVRLLLIFCYASAIFFIWIPDATNTIAQYFGIGRGLDFFLILLSVSIVNALIFIVRHINSQHQNITKLARSVALRDATSPPDNPAQKIAALTSEADGKLKA